MVLMKNKVVIVTGAGTGLGKAVAIKLAEEGAQVVLVGRRKEKLQDVAQIIKNSGGQSLIIPADITDQDDVQRLRDQVLEQTGRIDVLINNAGGTGAHIPIHDMTLETWDDNIRLNLYSPFLVTKTFLPIMRAQQYGRIVSITSIMANLNYPGFGAYSSAKAGLEALMRTIAIEEAKHGILVNMFDPGNLRTEQNPRGEKEPDSVVDKIVNLASLTENGSSGEVVRVLT